MVESGVPEFPAGVLKRAVWCHLAGIIWFALGLVQNVIALIMTGLYSTLGFSSEAARMGLSILSIIVSFLSFPFIAGFLYALIMWRINRDSHPFVNDCGKAATNFQATMGLYSFCAFLVSALLVLVTCGPALSNFNLYGGSSNPTQEALAMAGLVILALSAVGAIAWNLFQAIVTIMAAVKASKGQMYVYPLSRQFYS